jgi:hypothetical protein
MNIVCAMFVAQSIISVVIKQKHERSLKHLYAEYVNKTMFEIERIIPKKQKDEIIIIK